MGAAMTMTRCAAAAYLAAAGGLLTWSVLPVLAGWTPTVIMSGSMEPSLRPGDVVLFDQNGADAVTPGRIVLVDDPERPGTLVSHRVRAVNDDSSLTTKGDANANEDVTPVPASSVRGQARLLVPVIGRVVLWDVEHRTGAASLLALTLGATVLVFTPPARTTSD
jgi:signal peptidase